MVIILQRLPHDPSTAARITIALKCQTLSDAAKTNAHCINQRRRKVKVQSCTMRVVTIDRLYLFNFVVVHRYF